MRAQICFFVSIVFSFVAWGAVTGSLILPELRRRGRNEALRPLLMFHSFRFVGLAFLVAGVVSSDLPGAFAEGAAYGDIVAAALALLTLAFLPGRLGIVAAWVFNLWGSADILHANYEGIHLGVQAGQLGASPNVYRAALSDHARTHVLASTTKRKRSRSRRAGRAAALLK
jgi:hypothetical protein